MHHPVTEPTALLPTSGATALRMYTAARRRLLGELTERAEREQHLLAEQARGEERVRLAADLHDVVTHRVNLMDLRMPGVDGITAIEHISASKSAAEGRPVVVVLTTFDADHYVLRALSAGAADFLLKSTAPEDLIGLVRVAADGHTVLSPTATRRLLSSATNRQAARDRTCD